MENYLIAATYPYLVRDDVDGLTQYANENNITLVNIYDAKLIVKMIQYNCVHCMRYFIDSYMCDAMPQDKRTVDAKLSFVKFAGENKIDLLQPAMLYRSYAMFEVLVKVGFVFNNTHLTYATNKNLDTYVSYVYRNGKMTKPVKKQITSHNHRMKYAVDNATKNTPLYTYGMHPLGIICEYLSL